MKKLNIFMMWLMGMTILLFSACSDDTPSDDFGASPAVAGQGVYFAKNLSTNIILKGTDGEFELAVQRTVTEGEVTAGMKLEMEAGVASIFTVPSTVTFKDGEKDAKFTITYQGAVQGTPYSLKISFDDGTEYAYSTRTFIVEYPFPEVWEVVSENAVYIDQLFSMLGISDVVLDGITVEKAKGKNKYRFLSPYDNEYINNNLYGGEAYNALPEDFQFPYIILDGVSKTKVEEGEEASDVSPENAVYFIPRTALGFYLDGGDMEIHYDQDASWPTFGSMAYTFVPEDNPEFANYPLGTYNKKKQMFDLGTCFNYVKGLGGYDATGFQLWLDPTKMEVVYDRDYTWTPMPEATGTFVSGLNSDKWIQEIEEATVEAGEDPLYHLTSLYAPDVNIVFYHNPDKGTVRMPKKQKTGMTSFGNDVYVDMKKGSYDKATKTYTFELLFYLVDKSTGVKAELITTEEKFAVGYKTEIDDYLGDWNATALGEEPGLVMTVPITISKKNESTLLVKGFIGMEDYDDTMELGFNAEKGTLTWEAQDLPDITLDATYNVMGTPFSMSAGKYGTSDVLIGWLNEEGKIVFENASGNQYNIDSYSLVALENGGVVGDLVMLANLTWNKKPGATMSKKGFASPLRTYQTKLQYKAVPVSKTYVKKQITGNKLVVPYRLAE